MDRSDWLSLVLVYAVLTFWLDGCRTELREYCFPQTFNASCGPDAVIVVTSARYGRMSRGGKCLTSDYNVGCWADVLHQMDRRCSGRRQCSISIPDNTLHHLQPCPKDLLAYLETDYVCQRVESRPTSSSCRFYGDLVVNSAQSTGYLASVVTEENGFGSPRCPWIISAPRGQRLNVSLIDFGLAHRFESSGGGAAAVGGGGVGSAGTQPSGGGGGGNGPAADFAALAAGNVCHVYAKIAETGSATSEITICGSRTRQRSVYVSETNRIEIVITSFKLDDEPVYFLLKYEAIGCTDPVVPRGAYVKERVGDKAIITCNQTAQTWHIVCQGSTWYGKVDNCTSSNLIPKTSTLSATTKDRFPYGLPVAVVTGLLVGVLLGVAMLAVVIACLKRRKLPALRCAHDFLNGTPMLSLSTTTSPYGSAPDKTGSCRRAGHYNCPQGPGGTGSAVGIIPTCTEYGYTHICSGGGSGPSAWSGWNSHRSAEVSSVFPLQQCMSSGPSPWCR